MSYIEGLVSKLLLKNLNKKPSLFRGLTIKDQVYHFSIPGQWCLLAKYNYFYRVIQEYVGQINREKSLGSFCEVIFIYQYFNNRDCRKESTLALS